MQPDLHYNVIIWTKQGKEEKARTEKEVRDLKNSNLFLERKLADLSLEIGGRDRLTESQSQLKEEQRLLTSSSDQSPDPGSSHPSSPPESPDRLSLPEQLQSAIQMLQLQVQDLLLERKASESEVTRLKKENEDLRYELGNVREDLNTRREGMDEEREQWNREKEKVLRYQKQLNQNYILVLKRNKEIESEFKAFRERSTYKFITPDETKC